MFGLESVQLRDIADIIARDPTFSARVLQCANSAEFAHAEEITNVRQALTMLGLDRAHRVTISLAAAAYMKPSVQTTELQRCWRHMVACGVLSQEIASACGFPTDQAYTSGILHDIGRLGLLVAYPKEYEAVIRNAADRSLDLLDYEREQFGVDHCEAGRYLARRWNLPEIFRIIAGRHHDPPDGPQLDLLTIVHYACQTADAMGFDVSLPLQPRSLEATLEGLPPRAVERLLARRDEIRTLVEQQVHLYDREPKPTSPAPDQAPEVAVVEDEDEEFTVDLSETEPRFTELEGTGGPGLSWVATAAAVLVIVLLYALFRGV